VSEPPQPPLHNDALLLLLPPPALQLHLPQPLLHLLHPHVQPRPQLRQPLAWLCVLRQGQLVPKGAAIWHQPGHKPALLLALRCRLQVRGVAIEGTERQWYHATDRKGTTQRKKAWQGQLQAASCSGGSDGCRRRQR